VPGRAKNPTAQSITRKTTIAKMVFIANFLLFLNYWRDFPDKAMGHDRAYAVRP
jgi:hypothetical protein